MSRPPSPTAPGGAPIPVPDEPDEPMAADKRTLLIALVVMLALVLVGVATAAVFTTSACDAIDPDPIDARLAGTDVGGVLTGAFGGDLDTQELDAVASSLQELADDLGPITGIAEVTGADGLASGMAGAVATGGTTTALGPGGDRVVATAEIEGGHVVGDGDALYSLSIGNELTGQVDALLPVDGMLDGQTCVDTATIGTPLAFELDAADGELLLFRVEEDGDEPEAELRDPVAGNRWSSPLELGVAQPGVLGQRLTGRLGPDTAVVGYRTTPDAQTPVLTAIDRADGEPRWTLDRDELSGAVSPDRPQLVDVVAVDDGLVLVVVGPDEGDDPAAQEGASSPDAGSSVVLGIAPDDGAVRWQASLEPGEALDDVALVGDRAVLVVTGADGTGIALADGDGVDRGAVAGNATSGRVAVQGDRTLVVTDRSVLFGDDGASVALPTGIVGLDVLAAGDEVTALFATADENDGAIAVTFGG